MAFRSGSVAIVGKPNVGKSTLVNFAVGSKVAIVSDKPQTTRKALLGVANLPLAQIAFYDTPGIHAPHSKLGRAMVDAALQTLHEGDAAIFVVDVSKPPSDEDKRIVRMLRDFGIEKVVVALNKMDRLRPEYVQSNYEDYEALTARAPMMMTSAITGDNVDKLLELIEPLLPEGPPLFESDFYTNQSMRDMAAELIREQILHNTREEVPHGVAVVIDEWVDLESSADIVRIAASIIVERESQKPILIGKRGVMLKKIGTAARAEIEDLIGAHIFLELFVKVKEHWRDSPPRLREIGLI
jgi:GTP-binding protein Era